MTTTTIILSLFGGVFLGIVFYAGLWWTVNRVLHSQHPALLTLLSFWIRTLVVMAGFYYLSAGDWQSLLVVLLGFSLARLLVAQWRKKKGEGNAPQS